MAGSFYLLWDSDKLVSKIGAPATGSSGASVNAPLTGDGTPGNPLDIDPATTADPGSMSAADKTKLDALPPALSLPVSKANGGTASATGDLVADNVLTTPSLTSVAALAITAAAGTGAGTGSAIAATAGRGGATGFGGAVAITAGAGGATSGTGGSVAVTGGAGAGSTSGGGGGATVSGGAGGPTTGGGGVARLFGGAASAGNSSGGGAQVVAGASKGSGSGGTVTITGGAADTTGVGGAILITGGVGGTTSGAGGLAQMVGGSATAGSGANGGAATLQAGNGREAGTGGATTVRGGNGGTSGIGGAVDINGGTGASINGAVNIATTNASVVTIGRAGGSVSLGQGTVTQETSVTTGVTVNASSGVITTFSQSAAASATSTFTVTNSCVVAGSVVSVTIGNYAGTYGTNGVPLATVSSVSGGSFNITIVNAHVLNALSGVLKINFNVT